MRYWYREESVSWEEGRIEDHTVICLMEVKCMTLWREGLWKKKMMYSVEKFNKVCQWLYHCRGQALDGQQSRWGVFINFRGMQKCSVSLWFYNNFCVEDSRESLRKKAWWWKRRIKTVEHCCMLMILGYQQSFQKKCRRYNGAVYSGVHGSSVLMWIKVAKTMYGSGGKKVAVEEGGSVGMGNGGCEGFQTAGGVVW